MKVKVRRPRQIMDMGRDYTLRTEKSELGTISAGQEVEIDVPEDSVELFANLTWFTSNGVLIEELKENARLELKNRCDGWKLLIPMLPLYYITMAKYRYLKLTVKQTGQAG